MGIFGKSKKEKLLDAALLLLNEDKPERDKFLFLYRICQFDLKFNFEDNIDKILNDYKKEPIYPEQYKDLKIHLKALIAVNMEVSLFIACRDNLISKKDYNFIWENILEKSKKGIPNFLDLVRFYKEKNDASQPIKGERLSKEIFKNKLQNSLYVIRDYENIVTDAYRSAVEKILEQKLVWAYRYTD